MFPIASPYAVAYSETKDAEELVKVKEQTFDVVSRITGSRWSFENKAIIDITATFLYYITTTLSGKLTQGEDVSRITQTLKGSQRLPSLIRRLGSILLGIFGTTAVAKAILFLSGKNVSDSSTALLNAIEKVVSNMKRFMLFSFGYYTKIHHFVTGIEYRENERGEKHYTEQPQNICVRTAFITLGAAQFAIAVYEAVLIVKGLRIKKEDDEDNVSIAALNALDYDDNGSTTKASCSLCFSPHCENPCVTPCGHIFCWDCAIRALREKEECPICRSRVIPSQVIRVYNL